MSWVRLDDQFHSHPKLALLGSCLLPCVGLHALALSWCSAYLTDGILPKDQIPRLSGDLSLLLPEGHPWDLVARLVSAGLWEELEGDCYEIHDYLDYNPSRKETLKLRQVRAAVGKIGGQQSASKRQANNNQKTNQNPTPSPSPSPYPNTEKEQVLKTLADRSVKHGHDSADMAQNPVWPTGLEDVKTYLEEIKAPSVSLLPLGCTISLLPLSSILLLTLNQFP